MGEFDEVTERLARFYRHASAVVDAPVPAWEPARHTRIRPGVPWGTQLLAAAALLALAVGLSIMLRNARHEAPATRATPTPTPVLVTKSLVEVRFPPASSITRIPASRATCICSPGLARNQRSHSHPPRLCPHRRQARSSIRRRTGLVCNWGLPFTTSRQAAGRGPGPQGEPDLGRRQPASLYARRSERAGPRGYCRSPLDGGARRRPQAGCQGRSHRRPAGASDCGVQLSCGPGRRSPDEHLLER